LPLETQEEEQKLLYSGWQALAAVELMKRMSSVVLNVIGLEGRRCGWWRCSDTVVSGSAPTASCDEVLPAPP
jgi:hypothetical protein